MDLHLTNTVAVITGAGSGIGLATVKLLLAEGASVVAGDLNIDALAALAGDKLVTVQADLSAEEGHRKVIDAAITMFGQIDTLVNNIGVFPYREGFLDTSIEAWKRTFDINFFSMVGLTRLALPYMVARKTGQIISIASECARQPDVFFVDYSVTKAAMLNLSKSLANEFGPKGIRSNVVSPGPTRTHQWDMPGGFGESLGKEYGLEKEAAIDHFAKVTRKLPTGRLGQPEEVAAVIAFLASDLAAQATGGEYTVNGGSYIAA